MLSREDCFISISQFKPDDLLVDWRWLIGNQDYEVFRATALGDLFLRDPSGKILFLDMIGGSCRLAAESEQGFEELLNDREVRRNMLMARVVEAARDAGMLLGPGQCYSPNIPPLLSGTLDEDNLEPTSIVVHSSVMGQIHRQVKGLPGGTKISQVNVEDAGWLRSLISRFKPLQWCFSAFRGAHPLNDGSLSFRWPFPKKKE
jgi:hypothetical protein